MLPSSVLPYIPTFVKIVELKSFSKAASSMGITKSAVSKQIQALEDALKAKLIHRTTRSVQLTDEGETFFISARLMVENLNDAANRVQDMHAKPSGTLTVNVPQTFGTFHLATALAQFSADYPDIRLKICFTDILLNPSEENTDVTIRAGAMSDSAMMSRILAPCQIVTTASPEYLEQYGTPAHPDDLINHRYIHYNNFEKSDEFRYLDKEKKERTAPIRVHLCANNGQMVRQAALNGLGILRAPSFIVGNDIRKGKLVRILDDFFPTPEKHIYALFSPTRHQSIKLRTFLDFLSERFSGTPYWEV